MTDTKKPTGVGEDTAHRPKIVTEDELDKNWKRTFGNSKRRIKNASPTKERMETTVGKLSNISDEKMG